MGATQGSTFDLLPVIDPPVTLTSQIIGVQCSSSQQSEQYAGILLQYIPTGINGLTLAVLASRRLWMGNQVLQLFNMESYTFKVKPSRKLTNLTFTLWEYTEL